MKGIKIKKSSGLDVVFIKGLKNVALYVSGWLVDQGPIPKDCLYLLRMAERFNFISTEVRYYEEYENNTEHYPQKLKDYRGGVYVQS